MRWQWYSDGAFNPANLGNLKLWFDGSNASSITASGGAISQWSDLSGNSNHATQSGAGKPTVDNAAQNGLNAVKFVSASSQVLMLTSPLSLTAGYTTFAVGKRASTSSIMMFLGSTTTSSYTPMWYSDSNFYTAGTGCRAISTTQSVSTFNLICSGQNVSENTGFIRFNGSDITASQDVINTSLMTNVNEIGAITSIGFSDGDIGEYLLYNAVFTLAQIQQVEAYLKQKWATP